MTAVSRERETPLDRAEYSVSALTDRETIRELLEPNRAYSAYALAQLDPELFRRNTWYVSSGPTGRALLVHSKSVLGNALFALGEPAALDVALSLHSGPRFAFGSLNLDHRPVVRKYFLMTRPQLMLRMSVTRETFSPPPMQTQRLRGADLFAVNRLYSLEGGPTAYRAEHLDEAVYYGVYNGRQLIAIAGTHVVSRSERIAVVGNVFTHPRFRGQGLATATTGAVTRELLEHCDLVVLTVEQANTAAVKVYGSLGYQTQCELHETPLVRKEPFGAVSLVRRAVARWRGRHENKEVVLK
ncbi:MAG TPA: GNAT family N-acetyltransferase [Dehalococcoidia bacterium]|nr:GNAT family N-acetyltransferase [Dehalococcoidia bacterium]